MGAAPLAGAADDARPNRGDVWRVGRLGHRPVASTRAQVFDWHGGGLLWSAHRAGCIGFSAGFPAQHLRRPAFVLGHSSRSTLWAMSVAAYRTAFTDWLACACAGAQERAARAVRASGTDLLTDVAFAATAGHVLDFDDTLPDGVAHVSATAAPAALVLAGRLGQSLQKVFAAFAEGWEATAAVACAGHPSLYDRGWHPSAVCGPIGAAVAAARLLGLTSEQRETAVTVALLRAGGSRGAFGSDGKAIQVGLAAAAGVQGALVARGGASVDRSALHGPAGSAAVLGLAWPLGECGGAASIESLVHPATGPSIERNWIKLHPSCLGTHSPIDGAEQLRGTVNGGALEVVVHPVARQAAHLDVVSDGLSAKFSIPYCVAHTLARGAPRTADFAQLDGDVVRRAAAVTVSLDDSLPQWGAVLKPAGADAVRVDGPRGAPGRPITEAELAGKVSDLAGDRLDGVLDDPDTPAGHVLRVAGLSVAISRSDRRP
jgi:2-methylcitrate dehydratase PrpD